MKTTKSAKTQFSFGPRLIYAFMILFMILYAGVGVKPVSAASPSTISGNAGVAGATITWNGSGSGSDGSMTADGSGNYSFQVTYSIYWSGTVTPSKAGYTFSPTSRTYNFLTSNQTNQNYTATAVTYTISGSVGSAGGSATITYTGGSTTANSSGSYSFTVASGWSGTVTPTKNGYTFSPVNHTYTNVTSNQTNQNYTAALSGYTISGNVGTSSAAIAYSGGSTTANSSGDYSFLVSPGWSGTVTPSKTGFSFSPASRTYTNVTANQTAQNYTPRPTAFNFASMGDASGEPTYFASTANQVATLNPALVIYNGDLEANGVATSEMNSMVGDLKSANLFNKTFLVRGNGDNHVDGSAAMWENYFETSPNIPTRPAYVVNHAALDSSSDYLAYSFDYGNSIFIGLDVPGDVGGSGGSQLLTDAQLTFLDARLTYAEGAGLTHAFIFFHGPEYPITSIHSTCSTRSESNCTPPALMTIINNHPIVSATFHGHEQVLGWVHMDNTRISDLTRSYEEFFSSPAGGSTYNEYVYPDRMDYFYPDMTSSDFGFATISVNGLSFTYSIYKVGTTTPVWSHTFSKVNTPPTISDITDKTTNEDTATGAIPFTVGDAESSVDYLTITATSSNTTVVPNENISLGGSGANRTINISPAANQSGSATITVSVYDGNVTTSDTFLLTVNAVNDAPVADAQSVSTSRNTPVNIVLTGSDVEGSLLTFSIVDNPVHGSLSGSGANLTYTPATDYSGPDSFTFKANDGTVDSAPATVSINVTAYAISGNAGVAGATLSYMDGTPKTVTADGSGLYSFQVPAGWSGPVTPSKAGYTFSPESMSYVNVQADQTSQNYSTSGVMITVSGYAGVAGATLSYTDGTPKTATADSNGLYSFDVTYNWSGTVTPSKTGYGFLPASRTYTNVTVNQDSQDYATTTARVYYVDKTNPNCTDTGQVASQALPFCTIGRGANFVSAGQMVHVLHGTYAETINGNFSGTAGNPVIYLADPGVTVTGATSPNPPYSGFALSGKSYIVIDGFNITNTQGQGIYIYGSSYITIQNNHVSYSGTTYASHPYTQGIWLRQTTYSTITHNISDHNTCIGIRVVEGGYNTISNNTSFENFSLVETDAAGIELTGSSNNVVINNLVYSNEDSGINIYYFDTTSTGSSNNLVIGNLSYENGDHGIDNYQSPNNTIIGNTVQGNGTTGINFEGNTGKGSFGSTVENNILSANGITPPSGSWGGNLRFDTNSISGATADYNLFNRDPRATVQIIWNNINYTSLALFRAAVPAQEVHGLEGDPHFVNPVDPVLRQTGVPYDGRGIFGNYYPSAGAPEIDSANADAPSEQVSDIDGNSRIDDPGTPNTGAGVRTYDDRGAYEYLPAGPSLPIVTTQAVTNITGTTATCNGTITATGLPDPTEHGCVWGFIPDPTVLDNKTVDGPVHATGPFTSSITDLTPGTLYYVRAYATNEVGTVYGEDVMFTTLLAPAVTTQAVTNITATTATGNGNITALGVPNPTEHGVVWSTSANPTTADSKTTDGAVSAIGAFTSAMTGLTPGTLYHVRAYATNDAATVYGDEVTFTSLIVPTVTTQAVTSILTTTAVGNGNITSLGIPNPTQHGVAWALTLNPTTANSKTTDGAVIATGVFTSTITGLTPNTTYHVRAYATNTAGTAYGEDVTFTTLLAPTLTTQAVTSINTTTATGNGTVTVLGIPNPTEHGVVWSTSLNPTIADNKTTDGPVTLTGPFTSAITGLLPGTLYHVRAYATNAGGTAYGSDVTFTTLIAPTITTQAVSNILTTTAMYNGTIVSLGVPNPTQYGFVWDINPNPTVALPTRTEKGPVTVTGAFTSSITGLSLGQTYYVRAYATNAVGTAYGEDVTFTTLASSSTTTTPVTNARTGSDVSGTGTGIWISPGNITAADTNYAQVTLSGATSHYLEGTNYGFTIPGNAIINGIQVTIGRFESGQSSGNDVRDSVVSLMKSSTLVGSNKGATSTEWPISSPAAATYGANNDLWGTTWTPDEINASNFGVALSANSTNNRNAYVDTMQIAVTYTVSIVSSITSVNCGSGTPLVNYGAGITCVATVVRGSGTFTPTGNVSWTTSGSGSFAISPCTLSGSNGTATCSVTYTPSMVGTGSHLITATYAGDASFNSSNGSQTITVNKVAASVTPNALSKTYGDVDPTLTGTLTGFVLADNVTAAYSRVAGETVASGPYTISATLSPAGALTNYIITYNTAALTINKKDASVTLIAASKTYGDVDPVLNGTLSGFVPLDNVTATYSRTAGDTVGTYPISAALSPAGVLGNYNITNTPANFTINQKDASATVTAASKTYGDVDPILSGTLTGFLPADNVTATYGRTAGESVAGSPYTISATLSPAGVLGNYNITNTPAIFTINKKDATVTPDALNKVIGTLDPTLTGTLTGFMPADNVTATYTRTPGEAEGTYPITATLSPAGVLGNYNITYTPVNFTILPSPTEYSLTINITGNGTVTKSPDKTTYHYGDIVTLTATAAEGWTFFNWSVNVVDSKITIHGNTTVTAMFTQNMYDLVVNITGHGSVTQVPNQAFYHYGDVVTLTATPDPGWSFGTWSENVVNGTITITLTEPTTVSATFTQDHYTLTIDKVGNGTVTVDPVQTTYVYGDVVTMTATPDPGWSFGSWSANATGGSVTMHGNTTVTATFVLDEYTLTIDKVGNGSVAGDPVKTTYHYGDVVTLTATPDPGWSFGSWSANAIGGSVTIHGNTTVTATFTQDEYTLTINKVGSGSVTKVPDQATYRYGDVVTLTATPDLGWSFGSWSANVVAGKVTMLANTTVTATFTQDHYTLTIDKVGYGTVAQSPDQITYLYGDVVTLTPTGDPGWTFSSWSANATGGSVTIHGNTTVTATFTQDHYTLTMDKVGNGTVTKAPDQANYVYGDVVTLTATPDVGWSFGSWSANAIGGTVTIHGNTTVTATFTQDEYTLTIDKVGNGTAAKAPDQTTYHYGDVVTLTATPDPGWSFGSWSANVVAGKVTLHANTTVTATFTQDEYTLTINKVGNGTVAKAPDQATYHYGEVVTLTATPDVSWGFTAWSGDLVSGANPQNVTMNGNKSITATFMPLSQPTVTTQSVTAITATTATGNGNVTVLGVPNPTEHGVVWSTSADPTTADSKTTDGPVSATGAFTSSITGLTPGMLYHVRAYATNTQGTVYGADVSFTAYLAPTVTTQAVTAITTTTATGNGNVTILGVPNPTEHGVVWSTSLNPTTTDNKTTDGAVSATGAFTSSITGLAANTLYHVRAYATNAAGTAYGDDVTFTTLPVPPTVTTQAVTNIAVTTATGNGNITSLGVPNPTQYGVVWDTAINPTIALSTKTAQGVISVTGPFTSSITGLTAGTFYHVRAYATNIAGTVYGDDVTFTALYNSAPITTVATNAGTGTNVTGTGTVAWSNPSNITTVGTPYATVALTAQTSNYLEGTNYGFAIPANAIINGIVLTINRTGTQGTSNDIRDVTVSLMKAGVLSGSNKAVTTTDWPTSLAVATYGTNADLWGTTWTPADINNTNFGVALNVNSAGSSKTATVDYLQIAVTYTVPTSPIAPTVTTQAASAITTTTATGNGTITSLGIPNPTQYGVVWDTATGPTIALATKTAQGPIAVTGAFTSSITGLAPNTFYYLRAYATNVAGTAYGNEVTFTTLGVAPTVTTQAVTAITTTTATGNGNITALGIPNPTQYGVVWGTSTGPTIALSTKTQQGVPAGTGAFTSSITGLTPGTLYYVRAYATNTAGTAYGNEVTFTATPVLPTVTTQAVTAITTTTATGNGNITSLGGPNPTYGVVWDTNINPTVALSTKTTQGPATVTGPFTSSITGLAQNTLYHLRAYATNTAGTVYGDDVTFTTNSSTQTTTPATNARTGASVTAGTGTIAWSNPSNITTVGTPYATVALTAQTSQYLEGTNYGFAIPANATINGIVLTINRTGTQSTSNDIRDVTVSLMKAGVLSGSNKAVTGTDWPTSLAVATYGTNADLWGTTWTPADINNINFGVALNVNSAGSSKTATVDYLQIAVTYTVTTTGDTTSVNCGAGTPVVTYGGTITCVATVAANSGTTSPTGNVSWTTNGAGTIVTSPCTLSGAGGSATCSVTYTPTSVGSGSHLITATYAGDTNFHSGSASQTVTVNKKAASVTPNAASKTYGDADPALFTGTLTGFLAGDLVTATYSRIGGETVASSPYTISAVLSPAGVLANYTITYNTANFTINAKPASVKPDDASKTYGDVDPALSGKLSGFLPADNVTATYSRVAGETVEGSPYTISATLSPAGVLGNYNVTYNTANFTINQKDASVTPNAASKLIGEADPALTGTLAGFLTADNVTATYSRVAGETVEGSPYAISATLSPAGVLGNYNITYNTANFTITPSQDIYTLTINVTGGYGTVTKEPNKAHYQDGEVVTLTALPDKDWSLGSWSENVVAGKVTIHADTTVTATFVQVAPSFTSSAVNTATEDAGYTYNIVAADPDAGSVLVITAPTKPAWLTFTDNGNGTATLTGTPTNTEVGSHNVELYVTDGTLGDEQPFTIVVANTNDAPSFTSTAVTSAVQDTLYTYNITAADPDLGATLTITAPVKPDWLTFTDNGNGTATLTGTPTNANVGIHNVTLHVSDGTAGGDQVFTIDVGNTNDGPSFTSTAITAATEDTVYTYNITATDPDAGDTLTITATTQLPAWLTLTDNHDRTATLTGTPTNSDVGDVSVTLQVSDTHELATQSFTITVANVNDAPVLAQPADQNNVKGAVVSLQLSATDVDPTHDTLTYSASGLPGGLSIDPASGLISGTITADANTYPVTATVNDGNGGTDSKTFNWVVTETTTYTLTMVVNPVGAGTTDPAMGSHPYAAGTLVPFTATPTSGYTFTSWSGDSGCSDGHVTMDSNKTCTANFTQNGLGAGTYDDADPAWTYTGAWNAATGISGAFDSTLHYSTTVGDSTEVRFIGEQFQLIYTSLADRGLVDIFIDGLKVITLNQSGPGSFQQTWTSDPLSAGAHTARFVLASPAIIDIDAIKIIATANILTGGSYDETGSALTYTKNWYSYAGPGPSANTLHFSITPGEAAQFSFTGEQFALTYTQMSDRGIADVYVDGIKATTLDESGPGSWQQSWTSNPLPSGTHTVRFVHASGLLVDLDAIKILTTATILTQGKYDDANLGLIYSTNWIAYNGTGPDAGTLHFAFSPKENAQFNFTGQQFILTYTQMADRGVMDVFVDGLKVATIDESGTGAWQQTWASEPLPSGNHNVRFVQVGSGVVDIDAIQIITTATVLSAGTYDDADPAWHYSTYWYTAAFGGPYAGTLTFSINPKDSALVSFSGTQFVLTYTEMSDRGTMDIFVDGNKVTTLNENGAGAFQQTWTSGTFATGTHTVRLVHAAGPITDIDAITVMP